MSILDKPTRKAVDRSAAESDHTAWARVVQSLRPVPERSAVAPRPLMCRWIRDAGDERLISVWMPVGD